MNGCSQKVDLNTVLLNNTKRWTYVTMRTQAFAPSLVGLTHLNVKIDIQLDAPRRPTPPNISTQTNKQALSSLLYLRAKSIWVLKRGTHKVLAILLTPLAAIVARVLSKQLSKVLLRELAKTQQLLPTTPQA